MVYLTKLIERLETQLLEFDAVCYETFTSILTKNTLRRLDFAVSSSLSLQQAVKSSSTLSTSNSNSKSVTANKQQQQENYSIVPLISDANKLPPDPQRVLLLRGYVQKKIPGGRHPKILFLFSDVLMYGEQDEGTGRIKITTVLPLMIVSKKTLLPSSSSASVSSSNNNNSKKSSGGDRCCCS